MNADFEDLISTEPERQDMGIGILGGRDTIFPRAFRFTLTCEDFPNLEYCVQSLDFNITKKQIDVKAINFGKMKDGKYCDSGLHEWLSNHIYCNDLFNNKTDLFLNHFDGCGNNLYTTKILGAYVSNYETKYDYSSSEILTTYFTLNYDEVL